MIANSIATSGYPSIPEAPADQAQLARDLFTEFAGNTFFSQLISSMRKTVDKPAYFHGGRAETVFQSKLDEQFVDVMTKATAESFAGPMYELLMLRRSS